METLISGSMSKPLFPDEPVTAGELLGVGKFATEAALKERLLQLLTAEKELVLLRQAPQGGTCMSCFTAINVPDPAQAQLSAIEKYKADHPDASTMDAYVALAKEQPELFGNGVL